MSDLPFIEGYILLAFILAGLTLFWMRVSNTPVIDDTDDYIQRQLREGDRPFIPDDSSFHSRGE